MKKLPQIVSFGLRAFLHLSIFGLVIDVFFNIWVFLSHHFNWDGLTMKFYQNIDFTKIWQEDPAAFNILTLCALLISMLEIKLFNSALKLLKKYNLSNPFDSDQTNHLRRISMLALAVGLTSLILKLYIEISVSNTIVLSTQMGDISFLWLAAIIYIVSLMHEKGHHLQSVNDLTI